MNGYPASGSLSRRYSTGWQRLAALKAAFSAGLSRQAADGVAFSKHAISRAEERGIEITPVCLTS